MVRVFTNGPGDLGSIPSGVIPKTQKIVLDDSLLNTQHYKVRIKGKVEQSSERNSAPYTFCSRYWKGSLRVTLDYGRQLSLLEAIIVYTGSLLLLTCNHVTVCKLFVFGRNIWNYINLCKWFVSGRNNHTQSLRSKNKHKLFNKQQQLWVNSRVD